MLHLSDAKIEFYYHMYGSYSGTLDLDISSDNTVRCNNLFSRNKQQQNSGGTSWTKKTITLDSYTGQEIQLRLKATRKSNYKSDMAIGNVSVSSETSLSTTDTKQS